MPEFNDCDDVDLNSRMVISPSIDYIEENFNPSKFDKLSSEPVLEICLKKDSNNNPSLDIQVQYAPYKVNGGWENIKNDYINSIVKIISKYSSNIESCIENKTFITPDDIEQNYHVSGGHWHHGEIQIDQLFMLRPIPGAAQYKTHLDGLYLCGAGAHPGGGMHGISGKNAAKVVLGDL
jgi:phytoene dehydrogenase-like protein